MCGTIFFAFLLFLGGRMVLADTSPSLSVVTPIKDNVWTPKFVFHSDADGAVNYSGPCGQGSLTNAVAGNNTTTFATLPEGFYTGCFLTVTDATSSATSTSLVINDFTVNKHFPTFTVQYYSDAGLTQSLGNNPMLGINTYYLKITASETLLANPTITFASEGTSNDLLNRNTTHVTSTIYSYARSVVADQATTGGVLENILVSGANLAGNSANDVTPSNIANSAAYIYTANLNAVINSSTTNLTTSSDSIFTIGGQNVFNYKYSLDNSSYSTSTATTTNISLSGLSLGWHNLKVVGGSFSNVWQPTSGATSNIWAVSDDISGNNPYSVYVNRSNSAVSLVSGLASGASIYLYDPAQTGNYLDLSSLALNGGSGKQVTLPVSVGVYATTSLGLVSVYLPSGTQITASSSWSGQINFPQPTTAAIPDSSVNAVNSFSKAFDLGVASSNLLFDRPIKIVIFGEAGNINSVGYIRNGESAFNSIDTVCNTPTDNSNISGYGECKTTVGSDLVIWTKHLTKFVTYNHSVNVITSGSGSSSSNSGGGGGGSSAPVYESSDFSLVIDDGDNQTVSNSVMLTLNGGSDAKMMAVSNEPNFVNISQQTYATSLPWTLSSGDGPKTVYVRFYNTAGAVSRIISDGITLDSTFFGLNSGITPQVLGVKIYKDGSLLRSPAKRVYHIENGMKRYIATLKELKTFKQKIVDVTDQDLAVYPDYVAPKYPRNLQVGSSGNDVKLLQQFLINKNVGAAATKLAKAGANGKFGSVTQKALAEYQKSVGIKPANGSFGPITRAQLNKLP